MPTNLVEVPTTGQVVPVPLPGETRNAASVVQAFQPLANRAKAAEDRLTAVEASALALDTSRYNAVLSFGTQQRSSTSGNPVTSFYNGQRLIFPIKKAGVGGPFGIGYGFMLRSAVDTWYFTLGGNAWNFAASPSFTPTDMLWGGGTLVAINSGTATVRLSSDLGSTWSNGAALPSTGFDSLGRSYSGGTWIAAGTSLLATSTNLGASWTLSGVSLPTTVGGIYDARGQGYMLIIPRSAATSLTTILQSSDYGTTWAARTMSVAGAPRTLTGAAYNEKTGVWVIASLEGDTWTSSDGGVTWTQHTIAAPQFYRVASVGGIFVAITGKYVSWSRDGISWAALNEIDPFNTGIWHDILTLDAGAGSARLVLAAVVEVAAVNELNYRVSGRFLE